METSLTTAFKRQRHQDIAKDKPSREILIHPALQDVLLNLCWGAATSKANKNKIIVNTIEEEPTMEGWKSYVYI